MANIFQDNFISCLAQTLKTHLQAAWSCVIIESSFTHQTSMSYDILINSLVNGESVTISKPDGTTYQEPRPPNRTALAAAKALQNLQNQIVVNGLQEHVFLLGKKNQKEIRELFWKYDLYLLTAVAMEGGRRETQGLATIEAQACGLPAIVFDSGGVKYTVEDGVTGYVCEEYNTEDVVAKIKTLYNDTILLREMSKNTQKFVQEYYSLFSIEKKWEIIYKNIFN